MQRAASVAWVFSLPDITEESESVQSESIRDQVAQDALDGIQSTSVDGLTVTQLHPMARLDVADRLNRNSRNPFLMMRTAKLIPPGGGGS